MMSFRIRGLPAQEFTNLFAMTDVDLAERGAMRVVADGTGHPCRISLTDAAPGQPVVLLNYVHHATKSPYRASFAIYVREGEQTYDAVDSVPQQLRQRLLSLRAYDSAGMLRVADVVAGSEVEPVIQRLLQARAVVYVHVHFAKPGCYAALIEPA